MIDRDRALIERATLTDKRQALTYEEAERLALRAIHDADGRGMVGRGRNHLHQRVARALLSAARLREAELEAEVGRLREGVRRALTYMDPMSPGHSSHKMADARRVLQTAISHPKGADE